MPAHHGRLPPVRARSCPSSDAATGTGMARAATQEVGSSMGRYLVVANQTLGGHQLIQAARQRILPGPADICRGAPCGLTDTTAFCKVNARCRSASVGAVNLRKLSAVVALPRPLSTGLAVSVAVLPPARVSGLVVIRPIPLVVAAVASVHYGASKADRAFQDCRSEVEGPVCLCRRTRRLSVGSPMRS